jgi:phosphoglucomutase
VKEVPTKPIDGQKTGTSGLRKKTKVFMSDNYLANWVQSLFNALGDEVAGQTLALGGDGRCEQQQAQQLLEQLLPETCYCWELQDQQTRGMWVGKKHLLRLCCRGG